MCRPWPRFIPAGSPECRVSTSASCPARLAPPTEHTMPGVQSIGLDVNQQASLVNEGFDAVADVVRPTLRACLGALLVTCVCACGGGGGSSGGSTGNNNPPPPPTSAPLLAVTNSTTGTIDVFSISTKTG